jgi:hypothetical protein
MRKNTGNLNRPPRFRIKDHPYLEKGEGKRERKIEAESFHLKIRRELEWILESSLKIMTLRFQSSSTEVEVLYLTPPSATRLHFRHRAGP